MPTTEEDSESFADHLNEVRLRGRLASSATQRELPSGDQLVVFRVIVDRPRSRGEPRRRIDALECVAWSARIRHTVLRWSPGELVDVEGHLRRRFRRTDDGPVSRVEVEVVRARCVR
ncbi:MAG: single-stranded DNA-binding protein [Propionibacteriales bacterium]|nr:single-stranded DNA-binding protein [Propionibacteriales bacterium]